MVECFHTIKSHVAPGNISFRHCINRTTKQRLRSLCKQNSEHFHRFPPFRLSPAGTSTVVACKRACYSVQPIRKAVRNSQERHRFPYTTCRNHFQFCVCQLKSASKSCVTASVLPTRSVSPLMRRRASPLASSAHAGRYIRKVSRCSTA